MQLHFRFDEFLEEIRFLQNTASDLLENADLILGAFRSDLGAIRGKHAAQKAFAWEIKEDRPLSTIVSRGKYEPDGRVGPHHVQADISCKWRIRPIPPKKRKGQLAELFTLAGLASVKIRLHDCCKETDARQGASLGSFRMEIGMPEQPDGPLESIPCVTGFPGCFFHTQILGDGTAFPFPKTLSVPRFPSMIFSPVGVIEFVLGELFQMEWSDNQRHAQSEARGLATIQLNRFNSLLHWQQAILTKNERRSPWLSLKKAYPQPQLFVSGD